VGCLLEQFPVALALLLDGDSGVTVGALGGGPQFVEVLFVAHVWLRTSWHSSFGQFDGHTRSTRARLPIVASIVVAALTGATNLSDTGPTWHSLPLLRQHLRSSYFDRFPPSQKRFSVVALLLAQQADQSHHSSEHIDCLAFQSQELQFETCKLRRSTHPGPLAILLQGVPLQQ
jgi:hypothetical protein